MAEQEVPLQGGGRSSVWRRGTVVLRDPAPWSETVLEFLRHLEAAGFEAAPRVVGSGFDPDGRETLQFIDGGFVHPHPWPETSLPHIGEMLRHLHDAGEGFAAPPGARWKPWFGRCLGNNRRVYGHCDVAPWNIVERGGTPVALIDWETAGPTDDLVELGQAVWLNAQLHDDDVGALVGLAEAEVRAGHARSICDGYGLPRRLAGRLVQAMIDVAVADAADQAIEARIAQDTADAGPLWGLAWRARAAAWMMRRREMLIAALG